MRVKSILLIMLMCVSVASATVWEGSVDTDFFDPNNWNPIASPGIDEEAQINDAANVPVIADPCVFDSGTINIGAASAGVLDITGGTINFPNTGSSISKIILGNAFDGTINMSGGDMFFAESSHRNIIEIPNAGSAAGVTGTFNMTGGTLTNDETSSNPSTGQVRLGGGDNTIGIINITNASMTWNTDRQNGLYLGLGAGAQGTLNLFPGGTFTAQGGRAFVGAGAGGTGTIHVQGGLFHHETTRWLTMGNGLGSTGNIIIDSGQLICEDRCEQGAGGSTNITINGGGMYVDGDYRIGFGSSSPETQTITVNAGSLEATQINLGYDTVNSATTTSVCTMNINGGQVVTASFLNIGAYATVNLDGGFLAIIGSGSDDLDFPEDTGNFGVLDIDGGTLVWNGTKEAEILQLFSEGRITVGGLAAGQGNLIIVEDEEEDVTTATAGIANPDAAYAPSPVGNIDAEGYASTLLEWISGDNAVKHNIYFGTNLDDVTNRQAGTLLVSQGLAAAAPTLNSVSPGSLIPGTEYYWAVDSLDNGNNVIASGPVWTFDLDNSIPIDDIEDGIGLWTTNNSTVLLETGNLNRTGDSEVAGLGGFDDDDNLNILQWTYNIPGGAGQSASIELDLTGVTAWNATDLDVPNIETLGLRYHGAVEEGGAFASGDVKVFMQLRDAGGTSNKLYLTAADPNNYHNQFFWDEDYYYFEVALADFSGVNLAALTDVIVGAESRTSVAETGTLFIDNVAVYSPRCEAAAHPVLGDVDGGDCEVTIDDVEDVAAAWLAGPVTVNPTAPTASPLIYYPFDEDGGDATLVTDMSGNGNNATITDAAATPWVTTDCYDGGCIEFFNGDLEYVAAVDNADTVFANVTDQVTISMWIKGDGTQPIADRVLTGRDATDTDTLKLHTPFDQGAITWQAGRETQTGFSYPGITLQFIGAGTSQDDTDYLSYESKDPDEFRGQWNHYAFVKDSTAGYQRIYLNGVLVAEDTSSDGIISDIIVFGVGGNARANFTTWNQNYDGQVDEFRLYNTVLTQDEIASLAGVVGSFQQPTLEGEDLNGDGVVDFEDYSVVADLWLQGPVLFP